MKNQFKLFAVLIAFGFLVPGWVILVLVDLWPNLGDASVLILPVILLVGIALYRSAYLRSIVKQHFKRLAFFYVAVTISAISIAGLKILYDVERQLNLISSYLNYSGDDLASIESALTGDYGFDDGLTGDVDSMVLSVRDMDRKMSDVVERLDKIENRLQDIYWSIDE